MPSPSPPSPVIAPSLLAADAARLGEEVRAVAAAGADWIHVDVMDGCFVPNISFGAATVAALRAATDKPFDVHLMVERPAAHIEAFAKAGADIVTIHVEASRHLDRDLQAIRDLGKKAGVALNPATPPEALSCALDRIDLILVMSVNPGFGGQTFIPAALDKIARLRDMIGTRPIRLEVDGGVKADNAADLRAAGVDALVAGVAIFGAPDYAEAIAALRGGG